jgi:tetratricopeptide (TPR) repeat protein
LSNDLITEFLNLLFNIDQLREFFNVNVKSESYNGKWDDLKDLSNLSLVIHKDLEMAYFARAIAHDHKDCYKKLVIEDYSKCIELNYKTTLSYFSRGYAKVVDYEFKDYKSAIDDFNKVIELDPSYENAYFYRAWANFELNNYHECIKDYSIVIKLNKNNSGAFNNRALAKIKINDTEGALNDFSNAIELSNNENLYYKNRGDCFEKKGDIQSALSDYKTAINLGYIDFSDKLKHKIDELEKN